MDTYNLFCLCINDNGDCIDEIFLITISSGSFVCQLKDSIKVAKPVRLKELDADRLTLWKPLIPLIVPGSPTSLYQAIRNMKFPDIDLGVEKGCSVEFLEPIKKLSRYWPSAPTLERELHILVQVPQVPLPSEQRYQEGLDDLKTLERWRSNRLIELPMYDLDRMIDCPLPENEKVLIPESCMENLVSSGPSIDPCTCDDVKLLFRCVDGFPNNALYPKLIAAITQAPPKDGSESLFQSFWDMNIRHVLELIFPDGTTTRNSSENIATFLRPDYGFLLNKLCVFRGEEEPRGGLENPKEKLSEKIFWTYAPAPYVFGYYATGSYLTLVTIGPPSQPEAPSIVYDIAHADLSRRKDRIKTICRLINLSKLFRTLAEMVSPSVAEFQAMRSEDSTVEIAGRGIIKKYIGPDRYGRVAHLLKLYPFLQEKGVPHVDSLTNYEMKEGRATVILSPRGEEDPPKTLEELLTALICVLEALEASRSYIDRIYINSVGQVLHQEPQVFHRDIRWPNIMRSLKDPQNFFIVDWDDATTIPTKAAPHLSSKSHSPDVFYDGHGAEVDVWSVGELIVTCKTLDISLISAELRDLRTWMQGSPTPSAKMALRKIKEYQSSHF